MTKRSALNLTTDDLDTVARLAAAQRELGEIAQTLLYSSTSRRQDREQLGRRLNSIKASLHTVELRVTEGES